MIFSNKHIIGFSKSPFRQYSLTIQQQWDANWSSCPVYFDLSFLFISCKKPLQLFLADRTAARGMIGSWHDTIVCLSVCLLVTLCIMALRVSVGGWRLYRLVLKRALPIHFIIHFNCRMYRLATTAVGHIVQHKHTVKNRTAEISAFGIAMDHMSMAIPDAAFSTVRFSSYTVKTVCRMSYAVWLALLATAALLIPLCRPLAWIIG